MVVHNPFPGPDAGHDRSRPWRLGALLAVLVAALALVAAAAGAPKKTRFVSKHYPYSIALPGGSQRWQAMFALVTWTVGSPSRTSRAFDNYTDSRTGTTYLIAARPLKAGTTLKRWTAAVVAAIPTGCRKVGSAGTSKLGGARARVLRVPCSDGMATSITAVHGRRGYDVVVFSPKGSSTASHRRALTVARRAFRFAA